MRLRLYDYLSQALHPLPPTLPAALRAFAKWYFDLLKNLTLIAALLYFAIKYHNIPLIIIVSVSLVVMCAFLSSYLSHWQLMPFHPVKSPRVRTILNITSHLIALLPICLLLGIALGAVIVNLMLGQHQAARRGPYDPDPTPAPVRGWPEQVRP